MHHGVGHPYSSLLNLVTSRYLTGILHNIILIAVWTSFLLGNAFFRLGGSHHLVLVTVIIQSQNPVPLKILTLELLEIVPPWYICVVFFTKPSISSLIIAKLRVLCQTDSVVSVNCLHNHILQEIHADSS